MREIIDFHVHPYISDDENFNMYKEEFNLSWEEAMEELKAAGIVRIYGSVISRKPFDGWDYIKKLNDDALRLYEECEGFYIPGCHIHPLYVEESISEVRRFHELGLPLVGELVPYMHGWEGHTYASPDLQKILDVVKECGMIVSFHTMNEWQEDMEVMIRNNPEITFVAAHPGQKADCVNHVGRMEKYNNIYLDISGTGLFRYGVLKYLKERVGLERVLFGTDYPMTPPRMYIEAVNEEHIQEEDREKIFFENTKRLTER